MANVKNSTFGSASAALPNYAVDTTATINLGNAGDGVYARMALEVRANGAVFSIAVKKKLTGSGIADASALGAAYTNEVTGAVVATAITADALITVPAPSCDVILTVTMTSGTVLLAYKPIDG